MQIETASFFFCFENCVPVVWISAFVSVFFPLLNSSAQCSPNNSFQWIYSVCYFVRFHQSEPLLIQCILIICAPVEPKKYKFPSIRVCLWLITQHRKYWIDARCEVLQFVFFCPAMKHKYNRLWFGATNFPQNRSFCATRKILIDFERNWIWTVRRVFAREFRQRNIHLAGTTGEKNSVGEKSDHQLSTSSTVIAFGNQNTTSSLWILKRWITENITQLY